MTATPRSGFSADTSIWANDWRCGAVVYQVLVDRFAPPCDSDLAARRAHYAPPRVLQPWSARPERGRRTRLGSASQGVWTHELTFWGGTLDGVRERADHFAETLGADVLALGPLTPALTNHRYDAHALGAVAPELGGEAALNRLVGDLRARGVRLVLDGVFNHVGRGHPRFQRALADPDAPERAWFRFDPAIHGGYRAWYGVPNLPEVDLASPAVAAEVWAAHDAVVPAALRRGIAGWRLDVAHDLGPGVLAELRAAAHGADPDAWIVGEVWNDPEGWLDVLDGVLWMQLRRLIFALIRGEVSGPVLARQLRDIVARAGLDGLLRSWLVVDNHDTERLATAFPKVAERLLARVLQVTLPGCPVLYYGSEVAMAGGDDPANRAPMDWDRVAGDHAELRRTRALLRMRRGLPALRHGTCRFLDTERVLGFVRRTERADETVLVVVNPTDEAAAERLVLREPRWMTGAPVYDALAAAFGRRRREAGRVDCGTLAVEVPAQGAQVLVGEAAVAAITAASG